MYRSPSKQRQLIQRSVIYTAMTLSVIAVVTALVFIMLGYRFNRDTSTIQQGGLVQFASRPDDASITIGKAALVDTTPSKITVNPGEYDVSMTRSGYLPWEKNVDIRAGEVLWLNYAQLVPETVQTETVATFSSVDHVLASPNGKYLSVIEDDKKPTLIFMDVSGDTPKRTELTIPNSILSDEAATYSVESWSYDSERVLISSTSKTGTTDWLLVKRDDTDETMNISDKYDKNIKDVFFDPRSSRRLMLVSDKRELRFLDVGADSLSPILADNIESVVPYGDNALFYVRKLSKHEYSVGYLSLGESQLRELKRVSSSQPVNVAAASYFGDPYVAVAAGKHLDIYRLNRLPESDSEEAVSMTPLSSQQLPSKASYLSLRSSGRFVIAQYQAGLATYDIELAKYTLTNIKGKLAKELRWLDKYHFYVTNGKYLSVIEFDGGNQRRITDLNTDFDAVQSDNGKFIYSVTKDSKTFNLQRSQIILE